MDGPPDPDGLNGRPARRRRCLPLRFSPGLVHFQTGSARGAHLVDLYLRVPQWVQPSRPTPDFPARHQHHGAAAERAPAVAQDGAGLLPAGWLHPLIVPAPARPVPVDRRHSERAARSRPRAWEASRTPKRPLRCMDASPRRGLRHDAWATHGSTLRSVLLDKGPVPVCAGCPFTATQHRRDGAYPECGHRRDHHPRK